MTWQLGGRVLERVLVTRLRYLGDVVMATVVADVLRLGDPGLEVGFLCESAYAPVLAGHPSLTRVHRLGVVRRGADAGARTAAGRTAAGGRGTVGMIQQLRRTHYDLAVDLLFNPRSAWLLRLSTIPLRIGGTAGSRRRFYTHALPRSRVEDPRGVLTRLAPGALGEHLCRLAPLVHRESGRGFLAWFGEAAAGQVVRPRLTRQPLSAAGEAALARAGVAAGAPYVLAAPGATWPAKEWPRTHWTSLLEAIRAAGGPAVAVLVPSGAEARWSGLPGAMPALPLADVLGLLAGAAAVVTVDGGVMHAAVGLGTRVLALFGPTDPAIWFPYEEPAASRVLATRPECHPCDRHECPAAEFVCLPGLEPKAVHAALVDILAGTGKTP